MTDPIRKFIRRIPIAPSLNPTLETTHIRQERALVDRQVIHLTILSIGLALFATLIARFLVHLIGLITNIAFFHRWSFEIVDPFQAPHWGAWVVVVPVIGGIVVGLMARFGSKAIRGHGIPEAMEQVLTNESRIPRRITFLKPLSSAIAIGTGGPFGAEGPIIATGGALGSWLGQAINATPQARKTLLAAGAAAGMTAIFGSPVSAVLLAVELLLFEFRPRSLIPVALAAATANAARIPFEGLGPVFSMPALASFQGSSVAFYIAIGALMGLVAVGVTKVLYAIEDGFERLPIHWMWWPALGGLVVGVIGFFHPLTLGVGYGNIEMILEGEYFPSVLLVFILMKFVSWSVALGSGTSGGTLAPLFTIGGGLGGLLGLLGQSQFPTLGIDPKIAALVGMAAIFAGASRALLTSVVFAFEITQQPFGLLPLLGGCSASFLVSCYLMRNSIMTEKIVRRGVQVPAEYAPDFLDQVRIKDVMQLKIHSFKPNELITHVIRMLNSGVPEYQHQGFPVLETDGSLVGVFTRRDVIGKEFPEGAVVRNLLYREPVTIFEDQSLRDAADVMTRKGIGRLPVVTRKDSKRPIAWITRSDLLAAHKKRLSSHQK